MKLSRMLVSIVAVVAMVAMLHSPAWAAAMNQAPVSLYSQPQIPAEQLAAAEMMLAASGGGKPLIPVQEWTWVLSVVVPGLAQVLMGDVLRGVMFFLGVVLIGPILSTIFGILAVGGLAFLGPFAWIIGTVFWLISLGVWIWNIWDAYSMNQQMLGKRSEIQITPDLSARRDNGAASLHWSALRF